jgi:quinoprotein dehydrogenase-associated probable ABC transporter substrate-binding protein
MSLTMRVPAAIATLLVALAGAGAPAAAQTAETVDRTALRICADANNLPFSNDKGEGFENKIANLLAGELGVPVRYTFFPDTVGFIRNTLGARKCDLIVGTAAGNQLVQNSNPYYHSTYAFVSRPGAHPVTSIDDPALQSASIGIIAGTPPVTLLMQKGLLGHLRSYQLLVDTRFNAPGRDLAHDVATGAIDVGILWGPIAGYYAKQETPPLVVTPLPAQTGPMPLDYRITMGMRANEPEWKRTINSLIRKKQKEIDQILLSYGVPLLDDKGQSITH